MSENNNIKRRKAITLTELKTIGSSGIIIDVTHPNVEGKTIPIKVRRLDLTKELLNDESMTSFLQLGIIEEINQGKIKEDEIIEKVENKLNEEFKDGETENVVKIFDMIDRVCQLAMVEPTYKEFEEANCLTTTIKAEVYNWIMEEMKSLQKFRKG